MMRGLKAQDWGAGALLNAQEREMRKGTVHGAVAADLDADAPVETAHRTVPLDWTDYNGHMTEARYLQAFADATDRFMAIIGCDAAYIQSGGSYFTAETHIRHLDEVHAGAVITIRTRVVMGEGKKMHLWHEMHEGDRLLATGEHFLLHVSLETRKPTTARPAYRGGTGALCQGPCEAARARGAGPGHRGAEVRHGAA